MTTAYRPQGHDERALPEGPRGQDAARPARPYRQGKSGGGLFRLRRGTGVGRRSPVAASARSMQAEAEIVRRIFREYAAGRSPAAIAVGLNAEGSRDPRARAGVRARSTATARRNGILNNELYIGRLVWNRQRFLKDPDTGKRVARPNPESRMGHPGSSRAAHRHDALWKAVGRGRQRCDRRGGRAEPACDRRRPKHLFARLGAGAAAAAATNLISKDCSAAAPRATRAPAITGATSAATP